MRRLRQEFSDELVVIGVHSAKFDTEKATESIREAVMRHGIEHPVVNDADFAIWNSFAVRAWPTLVLIDPEGRVVGQQAGEIVYEDLAPTIRDLIDEYAGSIRREPLDLRPEVAAEPERLLSFPSRILLDGNRLFIADTGHHRIIEVALDREGRGGRVVRTFGGGAAGFRDGPAGEARFHDPHGMSLSGLTLYVADTENHAVRAIDLVDGYVSTVAGTGRRGRGLTPGGPALTTDLRSPWAVLAEEDLLLIAMAGSHQIWLLRDEEVGVFAGTGAEALTDGNRGEASFNQPSDMAYGHLHLFVCDAEASAIRAIRLEGEIPVMTLVGQGLFEWGDVDGVGASVRLQHPTGLAYFGDKLYIADSYNHKIKVLDPFRGEVETLIGTGKPGAGAGSFRQAQLYEPQGVAVDGARIYIADTNNHLIRVGDRTTAELHSLELRGLDRLVRPALQLEPRRLPPVTVRSGEAEISLQLDLPPGTRRNSEAPLLLSVDGGEPMGFAPGEAVRTHLAIEGEREVLLDLTIYYCEADNAGLCYIHRGQALVPIRIDNRADHAGVVSYAVGA